MLWRIIKGIRKQKIIDPAGNVAGYIVRKSACFDVRNTNDESVARVKFTSPLRVQIMGEGVDGFGDILLSESYAFMRPPMAEQMNAFIGNRQLCIKQSRARDFTFVSQTQEIGWLTKLPCSTQIFLTDDEKFDFVALLYILSWRMYHEDDADII